MQEVVVWLIVALCGWYIGRKYWKQWRGVKDGGCCSGSSCCCSSGNSVKPFPTPKTK